MLVCIDAAERMPEGLRLVWFRPGFLLLAIVLAVAALALYLFGGLGFIAGFIYYFSAAVLVGLVGLLAIGLRQTRLLRTADGAVTIVYYFAGVVPAQRRTVSLAPEMVTVHRFARANTDDVGITTTGRDYGLRVELTDGSSFALIRGCSNYREANLERQQVIDYLIREK